jgi:hypothetical protein
MRVRNVLLATGAAVALGAGISAPAQAASWIPVSDYNSKSLCVDAGQQYQREGWSAYKCNLNQSGTYTLWIR